MLIKAPIGSEQKNWLDTEWIIWSYYIWDSDEN